jgi:hypothetical protein
MGFFKKLFTSKKETDNTTAKPDFSGIYTTDYFTKRYEEQTAETNRPLVEGSLKMLESFFLENNIQQKLASPVNHPVNLDQAVSESPGFHSFSKEYQMEDGQVVMMLALAFSDFLINRYGLILYKDREPEQPLRTITLKYDKAGVVLSLYPVEYSLKVLNGESEFEVLHQYIVKQLGSMPTVDDLIDKTA